MPGTTWSEGKATTHWQENKGAKPLVFIAADVLKPYLSPEWHRFMKYGPVLLSGLPHTQPNQQAYREVSLPDLDSPQGQRDGQAAADQHEGVRRAESDV